MRFDLYQALNQELTTRFGNDSELKREWLNTYDQVLNKRPIDLFNSNVSVDILFKYTKLINNDL